MPLIEITPVNAPPEWHPVNIQDVSPGAPELPKGGFLGSGNELTNNSKMNMQPNKLM